jgi:hypothetical protein
MGEHRWSGDSKDRIRACLNDGCAVRRRLVGVSLEQWQAAPRHHWRVIPKAGAHCGVPIPPCTSTPSARCTHVERAPVALGRGHTVGGGIRVDECQRPALPRMVVCEHHATPDALRLVILAMAAEIERLMDGA